MRPALAALLVGSPVIASCASGAPERLGASAARVLGGTPDPTHDAVVAVQSTPDASAADQVQCTGTVLGPRVVLTAAHCVAQGDPSSLVVAVGANALLPTRAIPVARVVVYPAFAEWADEAAGLDLGVVVTSEDLGVAAIPLFAGDESALVGQAALLVGFGQSDATNGATAGTRREATVTLASACSALLTYGDPGATSCYGDSGGPVLVQDASGAETIAGVVSYGAPGCAGAARAVRVDRYATWIQSLLGDPADGGACASCPGPATDCEPDGGIEAGLVDAAPEAATASGPGATHGGCTASGARAPARAWLALVALGTLASARRRARLRSPRSTS